MRLPVLASVCIASFGAACGSPSTAGSPVGPDPAAVGPFEDEADYRAQRRETEAALQAAIGDAAAPDLSACRVVPTSEQACGGPTTFAVYSASASDAAEVERLAERLVALDEQANGQFEWVSTCMAYGPPTPQLRDGRCVDPTE